MSRSNSRLPIGRLDVPFEHLIHNPFDQEEIECARRTYYTQAPSEEAIQERQQQIDVVEAALEIAENDLQVVSKAASQAIQEAEARLKVRNNLAGQLEELRHTPIDTD